MTELDDFIRHQLDADEAQARDAAARNASLWNCPSSAVLDVGDDELVLTHDSGVAEHIRRHDPERVIIDCAARRALHAEILAIEDKAYIGSDQVERMLMLLAVPYAGRDGYRDEWLIPHLVADWGIGQLGHVVRGEVVRKELA